MTWADAVRAAGRGRGHDCEEVRHALCRLAVGLGAGERAAGVARHVRDCGSCGRAVDRLAELRRWLVAEARASASPAPRDEARVAGRLRQALARELAARLARDLLAVAEGRVARSRADRRRDVARLERLLDDRGAADPVWREAAAEVVRERRRRGGAARSERRRLLALAARLDPLGLDVVLCHLAALVRDGETRQADREAERWLGYVA